MNYNLMSIYFLIPATALENHFVNIAIFTLNILHSKLSTLAEY